jgi:hypothetical protein
VTEASTWRVLERKFSPLSGRPLNALSPDEARSAKFLETDRLIREGAVRVDSVSRIARWLMNISELERFVEQHRRLPRDNRRPDAPTITAEERRLEQWLNYQSRPRTRDLHCSYQAERLALLPAYTGTRQMDRWTQHLRSYAGFTLLNRRAPRLRSADKQEQQLARWAAKQRLAARNGELPIERGQALSDLPFWTWGPPGTRGGA